MSYIIYGHQDLFFSISQGMLPWQIVLLQNRKLHLLLWHSEMEWNVICGIASMSPTDSMSQSRHSHDWRSSAHPHIRSHTFTRS